MTASINSTTLPERMIVGYANWGQCDEKIVEIVSHGVNVLIWFSINLVRNPITGLPLVQGGPDLDCVGTIVKKIKDLGLPTVHLMSIGGWNSPHPDTSNSAEDVFTALDKWNREVAARPDDGFFGFDGWDWDIEGNDNPASPFNTFTVECLDIMGRISQLAKQKGYVFAMAPAESYLDPTMPAFDRLLSHTYVEWEALHPGFNYHGRNCYAYLLAKFGSTSMSNDLTVDTFDFITVQLYEGYSHAEYNLTIAKVEPEVYLANFVRSMYEGWSVDFSSDVSINFPSQRVVVPKTHLVIGLANGWAGDGKFLLIYPEILARVHAAFVAQGIEPRGYAFWNIKDEGVASVRLPDVPVWLAAGINSFLHARPLSSSVLPQTPK